MRSLSCLVRWSSWYVVDRVIILPLFASRPTRFQRHFDDPKVVRDTAVPVDVYAESVGAFEPLTWLDTIHQLSDLGPWGWTLRRFALHQPRLVIYIDYELGTSGHMHLEEE